MAPRTLLHKRYTILKVIGRGGMGAVYQARDMKRQGALCAIKEMGLSMIPSEEQALAINNFKIEAKMLSVLSHPYLPAFTHFFAENQRYFLVMEYIDGATLEELLVRNNGPFSEQRVLSWAEQLCDVLEYLHSQNPPIIFRDMKPGNVMLTRQGYIKLIDFGIARFFRPTNDPDTQLLGTPGYSPREQYDTTVTDERSDIYALGMTLSHLLTDQFSEEGFGVKAREIRAANPQVSVSVARVLEKATAVEPSDRYESVAAFRYALLNARAFIFESGESASEPGMLAKLCARYPEEAYEYLASGEIANWLRDIGEENLSAVAWHICSTEPDPMSAVEQFLHAILGPDSQYSSSSALQWPDENDRQAVQWVNEEQEDEAYDSPPAPADFYDQNAYRDDYQHYASGHGALSSHAQMDTPRYGTAIAVKPKTLDFGPVYPPNISAPLKIAIDSAQNLWVKGTIWTSESWIRLDRTEFDGTSTFVNVQIRSSQLNSYTPYRGEVIISPESGTPVKVVVSADIQGYTSQARRPGKTISPEDDDEEEEEEWLLATQSQQRVQDTHQPPPIKALDQKALTKYGPPNETADGWDSSMMTPTQRAHVRNGLTFTTACMASALWYTFLMQLSPDIATPSDHRFVLCLLGIVLASTLGAMLVVRPHAWLDRETLNRLLTGISGALVVLGPVNALLQLLANASGTSIASGTPMGALGLLSLVALTSLGATYSAEPIFSKTIWSRLLKGCRRARYIRWTIAPLAIMMGAAFGYLLTMSDPLGANLLITGFGVVIGMGIAFAFISRLDYLLKFYQRS